MIKIKSAREIEIMRQAGRIAANARELAGKAVRPGVTTKELDNIVREYILSQGAKPSFLGYNGFPASVCISVNEEVVHGIPGERVIREGDIVSVDVGAYYKGFHGDTADTFAAGEISGEARRLIDATRECFYKALELVKPGARLGDIGNAVKSNADGYGYGTVRVLTGHGVGRDLHEEPEVLNYGKPGTGDELTEGMVIAIEPMINAGTYRVKFLNGDWGVVTADGSLSAHYEHTVAVQKGGPLILTDL